MAGVRQHYIPRFLLKGFASREDSKNTYTWVHRKEGRIFETNIVNIALEKYFYGNDECPEVDDKITEMESELATITDQLRSRGQGKIDDTHGICNLIAHLVVRTKHIRESLRKPATVFADKLFDRLADRKTVHKMILSNREIVDNAVKDVSSKVPLNKKQKKQLREFIYANIPLFLDANMGAIEAVSRKVRNGITANSDEWAKSGHIKALSGNVVSTARVEQLCGLEWYLCNVDRHIILGDIGCVFAVDDAKTVYRSLFFEKDTLIAAYLPIAYNRLVIGTSIPGFPSVDNNQINSIIAAKSIDFFISNMRDETSQHLSNLIGTDADLLSEESIEKKVEEMILSKLGR